MIADDWVSSKKGEKIKCENIKEEAGRKLNRVGRAAFGKRREENGEGRKEK
jgi:hypothetical protein